MYVLEIKHLILYLNVLTLGGLRIQLRPLGWSFFMFRKVCNKETILKENNIIYSAERGIFNVQ